MQRVDDKLAESKGEAEASAFLLTFTAVRTTKEQRKKNLLM